MNEDLTKIAYKDDFEQLQTISFNNVFNFYSPAKIQAGIQSNTLDIDEILQKVAVNSEEWQYLSLQTFKTRIIVFSELCKQNSEQIATEITKTVKPAKTGQNDHKPTQEIRTEHVGAAFILGILSGSLATIIINIIIDIIAGLING